MTISLSIVVVSLLPQLLWHPSVAQTLGQEFVENLIEWIKEPNLIMKEIGLRGISNMALHPTQVKVGVPMGIKC